MVSLASPAACETPDAQPAVPFAVTVDVAVAVALLPGSLVALCEELRAPLLHAAKSMPIAASRKNRASIAPS